jgi:hypothetical protein
VWAPDRVAQVWARASAVWAWAVPVWVMVVQVWERLAWAWALRVLGLVQVWEIVRYQSELQSP